MMIKRVVPVSYLCNVIKFDSAFAVTGSVWNCINALIKIRHYLFYSWNAAPCSMTERQRHVAR
jgi:hypothetical protein